MYRYQKVADQMLKEETGERTMGDKIKNWNRSVLKEGKRHSKESKQDPVSIKVVSGEQIHTESKNSEEREKDNEQEHSEDQPDKILEEKQEITEAKEKDENILRKGDTEQNKPKEILSESSFQETSIVADPHNKTSISESKEPEKDITIDETKEQVEEIKEVRKASKKRRRRRKHKIRDFRF